MSIALLSFSLADTLHLASIPVIKHMWWEGHMLAMECALSLLLTICGALIACCIE